MKKTIIYALCIVMVVSVMLAGAACGGGGSGSDDNGEASGGEITAWDLTNGSADAAKKAAVAAWNEGNDIQIDLVQYENDQYKEKIQADMANGEGPDIIYGWGQTGLMKRWVDAGQIVDLTGKVDELLARCVDSVGNGCQFDGKIYGMPIESTQPIVMYYNKKLFEQAGAQYPTNWDEFLALIPTFKEAGIVPVSLAGGAAWTEMMWAEYLVDNVAGPQAFLDVLSNKAGAWTNPDVVKAMTMLEEFIKMEPFEDSFESVTPDLNGDLALICEDKAAMMLHGSWLTSTIKNDWPETDANVELGAFPSVAGKGDLNNCVGNLSNFWSLNAATSEEDQAAAIEFLNKEIYTDEYVDLIIEKDSVPPVKGIEDKLTTEKAKFLYQIINNAPSFQLSWDQALDPDASNALLNGLTELFSGSTTAADWCAMMDGTIVQ
jgi:raffinose/stachyose/melibiose transport system substrate-binding protein